MSVQLMSAPLSAALRGSLRWSTRQGQRVSRTLPTSRIISASSFRNDKPLSRPASSRTFDSTVARARKGDASLSTWLDPMDFGLHSNPMFELTNRLMEEMMSPSVPRRVGGATAPTTMLLDLVEKDNEYVATADLPGFGEEDVSITVDNRMLTIKARREEQQKDTDETTGRVVHSERRSRSFARTFRLPKDVDDENIAASMDKGILTLQLPRVAAELPTAREIPVFKGPATTAEHSLPENKQE